MERRYEYAGFWLRFWAATIDSLLIIMITAPLMWAIYGDVDAPSSLSFWSVVIQWIFPMTATVWMWKVKSATPGKMMLSLKVVDEFSGGPLSNAQCVWRYFAYIVSTIPFFLGFIWVAFDSRKRAFHDMMANSVVIRDLAGNTEPVIFGKQQ